MRTWVIGTLLVGISFGASCTPTPAVSVVRTTDKAEAVRGDTVKLKRGPQEAYAGARSGFYVVRGHEDWQNAWRADSAPALPPTLDTETQMLLLAVAENKDVRDVKFERAVETAEMIYVWVRETSLGEGCKEKRLERPAFDAVVTARVDKPVRFFVSEQRGESCGEPPVAGVACRIASVSDAAWSPSLTAQPGDTVECELTARARGKFEIVDRVLQLADQPGGSTAKLAFSRGPTRASIDVDVYGSYAVRAEVTDEAGRRGISTASIDARPPRTRDVLVQVVWTNFDLRDEPDTFPRVVLRVTEPGPKGQRCTAEVPVPGLCDARQQGAYTYMKIPESERKLPVSLLYLDERIEKGPGPCIHVWLDGQRTAEICDRKARAPEERWEAGVIDTTTGKILDASVLPPEPAEAPDAGAPAKKPAPKPAPKKK